MILKQALLFSLSTALLAMSSQVYSNTGSSLRFAVDNQNSAPIPPYSWYNHCEQRHQGFNNELYRKIAADLALQAEFVEADLADNTINMLNQSAALILNNKADFALVAPSFIKHLGDITIGKEQVFSTSPVLVLATSQADISDIKELETLTGVGVNIEDAVKILKLQNININVNKVVSMKQAAMHLATDKEDYWFSDKFIAQHLINELDIQNKIKFSKLTVGTSTGLYMVTNNQPVNQKTMRKIDGLVSSYQQSGYIDFLKFRVMQSWLANKDCVKGAG